MKRTLDPKRVGVTTKYSEVDKELWELSAQLAQDVMRARGFKQGWGTMYLAYTPSEGDKPGSVEVVTDECETRGRKLVCLFQPIAMSAGVTREQLRNYIRKEIGKLPILPSK